MKIPKRNGAAIQPPDADAILHKLYRGLSREELERAAIDQNKQIFELSNRDGVKAGADENESPQRILTLRSPDELLGMVFDNSDIILGDRLLAKGQPLSTLR